MPMFPPRPPLTAQASKAMRPPAGEVGRKIPLERIAFVWRRLSFRWKMVLRHHNNDMDIEELQKSVDAQEKETSLEGN